MSSNFFEPVKIKKLLMKFLFCKMHMLHGLDTASSGNDSPFRTGMLVANCCKSKAGKSRLLLLSAGESSYA